jgi:hypothetical protein
MTATPPDAEDAHVGTCSFPGCTAAAEDGECANGKTPIDCEHFALADRTSDQHDDEEAGDNQVVLPSSEGLRPRDLDRVLNRQPASFVVPLAHSEAGKTTLFTLAFEFLTSARFERWRFVSSETLMGFARRRYYTSTKSGRNVPATDRTSRDASDQWLHVDARRTETDEVRSVLFADISGELVEDLVSGSLDPMLAAALLRADHVLIVIDGAAIADPAKRQNAIREAREILWMLRKVDTPPSARISFALTKVDLLEAEDDTSQIFEQIANGFPELGAGTSTFTTADRTGRRQAERGKDIELLFDSVSEKEAAEPPGWGSQGPPAVESRVLRRMWDLP